MISACDLGTIRTKRVRHASRLFNPIVFEMGKRRDGVHVEGGSEEGERGRKIQLDKKWMGSFDGQERGERARENVLSRGAWDTGDVVVFSKRVIWGSTW